MSFDLSKIEGLTEEQQSAIIALAEESEKGLKSKTEELLGELKATKAKIGESESAAEEARRLAAEKEELRLKAEGDIEGLKKHYEAQLSEHTAKLRMESERAQNALLERDKSLINSQIKSKCDLDRFGPFVEAMLEKAVSVSYNEEGKAVTELKLGDQSFSDVESFLSRAEKDSSWQNVLLANNSIGGGAVQTSGGATESDSVQSRLAARLAQKGLIK